MRPPVVTTERAWSPPGRRWVRALLNDSGLVVRDRGCHSAQGLRWKERRRNLEPSSTGYIWQWEEMEGLGDVRLLQVRSNSDGLCGITWSSSTWHKQHATHLRLQPPSSLPAAHLFGRVFCPFVPGQNDNLGSTHRLLRTPADSLE